MESSALLTASIVVVFFFIVLILMTLVVRNDVRFRVPLFLVVISFLLLVFGVGMIYSESIAIIDGLERRSWPVVKGRIVTSEVSGTRAAHPEIHFEYTVDGVTYSGSTDMGTPGFGSRNARKETAGTVVRQYPPESLVLVHYSPNDHAIGVLRPGPEWSDFMRLSAGIIAYAIGLFVLMSKFAQRWTNTN
jgi:hypothetical protein